MAGPRHGPMIRNGGYLLTPMTGECGWGPPRAPRVTQSDYMPELLTKFTRHPEYVVGLNPGERKCTIWHPGHFSLALPPASCWSALGSVPKVTE